MHFIENMRNDVKCPRCGSEKVIVRKNKNLTRYIKGGK
jgi:Zn finger protein HypA/HybF involved in hydrogenase expression